MTNKLRNNTIKSYKLQNQHKRTIKKLDALMDVYFTSKITPAFYKNIIKNSI
jgi:hypothetical protein